MRSVSAEIITKRLLEKRGIADQYHVFSRGMQGFAGMPAPEFDNLTKYSELYESSRPTLERLNIDVSHHVSTPVSQEAIDQSDVVIAFDHFILDDYPNALSKSFPEARSKMHLFLELEGEKESIIDPGDAPDADYHKEVFERINRDLETHLDILLGWANA